MSTAPTSGITPVPPTIRLKTTPSALLSTALYDSVTTLNDRDTVTLVKLSSGYNV
jgi:hypothetical protein